MIEMTQAEVDAARRVAEKVHAQAPNANPQAAFLARAVRHLAARQMPALRWEGDELYLGTFVVGIVVQWNISGKNGHGQIIGPTRTAVEAAVRKELGVGQ